MLRNRSPRQTAPFAVIFDMDGVLVDSARFHEESWQRIAREIGRPLPPGFFHKTFGMTNPTSIRRFLAPEAPAAKIRQWSLRKEIIFRDLCRDRIRFLPGAEKLVRALAARQIPLAVGSSTERANIEMVLGSVGLGPLFKTIVSSEDVRHGKPDPEVFLKAAARLGMPPARCAVVEDAHVGIEAARRAGMPCLAVATTHPRRTLAGAGQVVGSLQEITVDAIARLVYMFARCPQNQTCDGREHPPSQASGRMENRG